MSRRSAVLLLLPAGVLSGHALGYAGAGHGHGGAAHAHGYLGVVAPFAVSLALLAVFSTALRPGPQRGIPFPRMLALQWATLLFQEAAEHLVAGEPAPALLLSQPLWLGLAAQLAVAAGATLLLRSARALGVRLATLPARAPLVLREVSTTVTAPVLPVRSLRVRVTLPARAPPALAG